jgi:glycosyltransferase involved in cell wall biosynthesis
VGGARLRRQASGLPTFTVLMPVRNAATTIERAIESVLAQDYPNVEFIVVDGSSGDGTTDVLRRYDQHISYWLSEPDGGAQDAQNKALALATGEFATILMGDDWLADDFVSKTVAAFLRTNADFVFGDLELYEGSRRLYRHRGAHHFWRTLRYELSFTSPGWSFRRVLLNELGLMKLLDVAPDYEWVLRAHLAGKKGAYDDNIVCHFALGGNSTLRATLGFDEIRRISIEMGGNVLVAWIFYLRSSLKHRVRLFLDRILPMTASLVLRRTTKKFLNLLAPP